MYDSSPCQALLKKRPIHCHTIDALMSAPRKDLPASGSLSPYTGTFAQPTSMQMQTFRVTDHDVLSGRGVNIAQHTGNERFRALINSRYDVNYCHAYTTAEKRAIAEEIVGHIKSLNPPGRFLRRCGRSNRAMRGLDGPWEELTKDEAIKKTCQALRDCNRQDRSGYAASVSVPADVSASKQARSVLGLTNKQLAEIAAAQLKQRDAISSPYATNFESDQHHSNAHHAAMPCHSNPFEPIGEATSSSANLLWSLKGYSESHTPIPLATPTTSGSSGGYSSMQDESHHHDESMHHHRTVDEYSPVTTEAMSALLSTDSDPVIEDRSGITHQHRVSSSSEAQNQDQEFDDCNDDFSTHFDEDDDLSHIVHDIDKHSNDHNIDSVYDLSAEAAVSAAMEEARSGITDGDRHCGDDFGPPSPLNLHHHNDDDPF